MKNQIFRFNKKNYMRSHNDFLLIFKQYQHAGYSQVYFYPLFLASIY